MQPSPASRPIVEDGADDWLCDQFARRPAQLDCTGRDGLIPGRGKRDEARSARGFKSTQHPGLNRSRKGVHLLYRHSKLALVVPQGMHVLKERRRHPTNLRAAQLMHADREHIHRVLRVRNQVQLISCCKLSDACFCSGDVSHTSQEEHVSVAVSCSVERRQPEELNRITRAQPLASSKHRNLIGIERKPEPIHVGCEVRSALPHESVREQRRKVDAPSYGVQPSETSEEFKPVPKRVLCSADVRKLPARLAVGGNEPAYREDPARSRVLPSDEQDAVDEVHGRGWESSCRRLRSNSLSVNRFPTVLNSASGTFATQPSISRSSTAASRSSQCSAADGHRV